MSTGGTKHKEGLQGFHAKLAMGPTFHHFLQEAAPEQDICSVPPGETEDLAPYLDSSCLVDAPSKGR